jgi:predicted phosphodiesterase
MKFVLLSDVHLLWENPVARMDDLVEVQFDKLGFIFDKAKELGAPILQSGDLFDKPRSWGLLPRVVEFLMHHGVKTYCVMGQHDTYMYSEETRDRTNLGILAKAGLVTLLDNERPVQIPGTDIQIFGANFGHKLGSIQRKGVTLGIIHASISMEALYPGQIFSTPVNFMKENPGYDLILCGDIHRMFYAEKNGCQILNTGPMTRQEATEYNFEHKPGFAVLETDDMSIEWIEIPHSPADSVLSRSHLVRQKENKEMLGGFVSELSGEEQISGVSFIENLWDFVKENRIEQSVVDILAETIEG